MATKKMQFDLYTTGILAGVAFLGYFAWKGIRNSLKPPKMDGIPPNNQTPEMPDMTGEGGVTYSTNQLNPSPVGVPSKADLQSPAKLQAVFDNITKLYGKAIAQNVERIYRWETAHFKSGQYLATGSAGMTTNRTSFPWGWSSLKDLWTNRPDLAPIGRVAFVKDGKTYNYLAFSGAGGFVALAQIMALRGNNPGRWNSSNQAQIDKYNNAISGVRLTYTK